MYKVVSLTHSSGTKSEKERKERRPRKKKPFNDVGWTSIQLGYTKLSFLKNIVDGRALKNTILKALNKFVHNI